MLLIFLLGYEINPMILLSEPGQVVHRQWECKYEEIPWAKNHAHCEHIQRHSELNRQVLCQTTSQLYWFNNSLPHVIVSDHQIQTDEKTHQSHYTKT